MQPNYNIGAPVLVVPMSTIWNRNFMPMDANGEIPVSLQWFDASSINWEVQRPDVASREVDAPVASPKSPVLNPADFMRGGSTTL